MPRLQAHRSRAWIALALAATTCSRAALGEDEAAAPSPGAAARTAPAPGPTAIEASPPPAPSGPPAAGVAVARLDHVVDECSGLGGVHALFTILSLAAGGGVTRAHFGGHGVRGLTNADLGRLFVVEVIPRPTNFLLGSKGWCVDDFPAFDGLAGAMTPAADLAQARELAEARAREARARGWTDDALPPACAAAAGQPQLEREQCIARWHAPMP